MPKKYTHSEYLHEIKDKSVTPLEKYKNTITKIKFSCDICGHGKDGEWSSTPKQIKRGSGCPKCANKKHSKKMTLTHSEYLKQIKDLSVTPLEEYKSKQMKIKHQCDICGHGSKGEWCPTPERIKKGHGCPRCARDNNGFLRYKNKPTWLYYIKINNTHQHKIGVARKYKNHKTIGDSVSGRFASEIKRGLKIEVINGEFHEDGYLAFQREQYIIQGFKNHLINKKDQILNSGHTETFTHDVLN